MSAKTEIAWTDATFNPWWGCVKVSEGCHHCYAETFAKRVGQNIWGPASTTSRRLFGAKHWQEPLKWNAAALATGEHRRVFCASMADVFEAHPMVEPERQKLWTLIENTPWLDWQLLTKRPENVLDMVPAYWLEDWPVNAWIGTSVEHQEAADLRIPILLQIPAHTRFLSCEPLLGPVELDFGVDSDAKCTCPGEHGLPGSRERRVTDRQPGENLESCIQTGEPVDGRRPNNAMPTQAGRASTPTRVSANQADDRRPAVSRLGSSFGLSPLQRADSRWANDQSSQRSEVEQSTGEPGDSNRSGASTPCVARSQAGPNRSERSEERDGSFDNSSSSGDQTPAGIGREIGSNSSGFRSSVPAHLEDCPRRPKISWLIAGGESGPKHRPLNLDWARSLRDQCVSAGIAYFFKQVGGRTHAEGGNLLDGREWTEFPGGQP